ncbi:hypothetical protein [Prochlorothrix hollandica]|uniref:hypothetical protein n=1 Tax=Prochlorothrix hollandica TaxID=1223 RepID=UPI00036FDEB8|nr:hypothetical protein [Prochlorothrix hollandica]
MNLKEQEIDVKDIDHLGIIAQGKRKKREGVICYSNPKSVVGISMAETLGVVCPLRGHTTRPI